MAHKISKILLVLLLLPTSFSEAASKVFKFDTSQSTVEFLAIGKPSMLKIRGTGGKVSGEMAQQENKLQGKIQVDLKEFDTGMALRNQHMKEKYLQVQDEKNRYATFEFIEFEASDVLKNGGQKDSIPFKANLTLHGIQKEVSGLAKLNVQNQQYSGNSKLKIKLSDFGIDIPSFAGVTVAEDVDIDISFKGTIADN